MGGSRGSPRTRSAPAAHGTSAFRRYTRIASTRAHRVPAVNQRPRSASLDPTNPGRWLRRSASRNSSSTASRDPQSKFCAKTREKQGTHPRRAARVAAEIRKKLAFSLLRSSIAGRDTLAPGARPRELPVQHQASFTIASAGKKPAEQLAEATTIRHDVETPPCFRRSRPFELRGTGCREPQRSYPASGYESGLLLRSRCPLLSCRA